MGEILYPGIATKKIHTYISIYLNPSHLKLISSGNSRMILFGVVCAKIKCTVTYYRRQGKHGFCSCQYRTVIFSVRNLDAILIQIRAILGRRVRAVMESIVAQNDAVAPAVGFQDNNSYIVRIVYSGCASTYKGTRRFSRAAQLLFM